MNIIKDINQEALRDPQPGDYWHERFYPYFFVVDVNGDRITILNCIDKVNSARVDYGNYWEFDYSKGMEVDILYLEKLVKYEMIDGFVADVTRLCDSKRNEIILSEWREWKIGMLSEHINKMQEELGRMDNRLIVKSQYNDDLVYKEISQLALYMWNTFYREDSPNFELCDSVRGIISQIDNMLVGLERGSDI